MKIFFAGIIFCIASIADLKDALVAYKDGGVFSTVTEHIAQFLF
jgi:hypothetical protein